MSARLYSLTMHFNYTTKVALTSIMQYSSPFLPWLLHSTTLLPALPISTGANVVTPLVRHLPSCPSSRWSPLRKRQCRSSLGTMAVAHMAHWNGQARHIVITVGIGELVVLEWDIHRAEDLLVEHNARTKEPSVPQAVHGGLRLQPPLLGQLLAGLCEGLHQAIFHKCPRTAQPGMASTLTTNSCRSWHGSSHCCGMTSA